MIAKAEIIALDAPVADAALDQLAETKTRSPGPTHPFTGPSGFFGGMSDNDLLHMALGVET